MAFNIPVQTSFAENRPILQSTPWVRPADWISITDSPNLVQFLVSDAVYPAYSIQTTFTQTGGVGNIYINWGDGTVTTVSTTAATNSEKTYTTGGTFSTQGYNTWKITISGDAGTRITQATFVNPSYWGAGNQKACGLLEEYYGDNTVTSIAGLHFVTTTKPFFHNLKYSKAPLVITGTSTLQNAYYNCTTLQSVVLPTSMPGCLGADGAFYQCYELPQINFPQDATGVVNLSNAFGFCYSLTGITLPPTLNSVTNLSGTFTACRSISNIYLPSTPQCANYNSTFSFCQSLLSQEVFFIGSGASSTITSMFQGCVSLEYVKFPTSVSPATIFTANDLFNGCRALKSCIFPDNFNASTLASTFRDCNSLTYVSMPSNMPALASLDSTFLANAALSRITLPTTSAATITLNSTFNGCQSLSIVNVPSGYNITSLASTFNGCNDLVTVTLPTGAQNSLTSMASTFSSCFKLENVTLPSSMTAVTSLSNTFASCYSMTSITLPSTMNSVTTIGSMCGNAISLRSITLPTSMTALTTTGLNSAFSNCYSLSSCTLPVSVNAGITQIVNLFSNCYNLRNVVLPTTQTTSLTTITTPFTECLSLTGITNADKLGQNTVGGGLVTASLLSTAFEMVSALTLTPRFAKLTAAGASSTLAKLNSLRLSNTGSGQWTGTSPQIDISYTSLSTAALNLLFADIAAQGSVVSKTINITGAVGAAGLSAGDRAVLTSIGWTITG